MNNKIRNKILNKKSFPPKAPRLPAGRDPLLAEKQRFDFIFANLTISMPKIIFSAAIIIGIATFIFASQAIDRNKNQLNIIPQASAQMIASFTEDFSTTLYIDAANTTAFHSTVATQISLTGDSTVVETEPMDVGELVEAAPLTGGGYVVLYGFSGNQQYFQIYDSNGNKSGSQVAWWPVGTYIGSQTVAALAGGGFVIAYNESNDIYIQQYNSSGTQVGSTTQVNASVISLSADINNIISHANGDYSIIYANSISTSKTNYIYTRRYNSSASPVTSEIAVNTYPGYHYSVWVASLQDGGYLIAWTDDDEGHTGLFIQRFNSSNNKICFNTTAPCPDDLDDSNGKEPEYLITNEEDDEVGMIQLANGKIVIAKSQGFPSDLRYYMYESDGTVIAIPNNNCVGLYQEGSFQDMVELAGGGFVIVRKMGYSDYDIAFNILDNEGNAINPPSQPASQPVNTYYLGYQTKPSIIALDTGGFVIIWRDEERGWANYLQLFDSDGNKVGEEQSIDPIDGARESQIYKLNSFIIPYRKIGNDVNIYIKHFSDTLIPALFDLGPQTVRSARVNPYHNDISEATFTATDTLNGQAIDYYLSNDGGATWEPFAGNPHVFTDPSGDDLRWRADLTSVSALASPIINSIAINYTYGADRDPVTYTVCPAGAPTCDYATIQDAVNVIPATLDNNYIIDVYSGTYGQVIIDDINGSFLYSLTVQEHSGENSIIDGTGAHISSIRIDNTASYIVFDGLEIKNDGTLNGIDMNPWGTYVHHITVQNCNIHTVGNDDGIRVGDYATIYNNTIHDFSSDGIIAGISNTISFNTVYNGTDSAKVGINVGINTANYSVVQNNTIYNMAGDGITTGLFAEVYQNKIYSCGEYGIMSAFGLRTIIKNNIIYDNQYGGVFLGLFGGYGNEFENNIVYGNGCFGAVVLNTFLYSSIYSSISPGLFKNNIIANNDTTACAGGLGLNWGGFNFGPIGTISYNLAYNNGLDGNGHVGGAPYNSPELESASNTDHFYIAEPLFTDMDGVDNILGGANGCDDDFTLLTNSPGVNLGDPTSDYSNEPAPNGGRIDMGAYGGLGAELIGSGVCGFTGSATPSNNTAPSLSSLSASGNQEITISFYAIDAESDTCNVTPTLGSGILYSIDNYKWHLATILNNTDINLVSSSLGTQNSVIWDAPADIAGYSGDVYLKARISDGSLFSEWEDYSFNTSTVGTRIPGKIYFKNDLCADYISQITLSENLCIYQIDNALNEDPGTAETVDITVTSTAGDNETLVLAETGVDTGIFQLASIPTAKASPAASNGTIEAARGNTITAEYAYASPVSITTIDDFESYASTADMLHPLAGGTGNWLEAMEAYYGQTSNFELGTHNGYFEAYSESNNNPVGLGVHKALSEVADLDGQLLKFKIFLEDPDGKLTSLEYPAPGSGFFLNEFLVVLVDDNPFGNPAPGSSYIELNSSVFTNSNLINWGDWDNDWDEIEIAVNNTNFANFPQTPDPAELDRIERIILVPITGDGAGGCASIRMKLDDLSYGSLLSGFTDIDSLTGYVDTATMETNGGWDLETGLGTGKSFESTSTKVAFASAGGVTNDLAVAPTYIAPVPLDLDGKNLDFSIYMDNPNALHPTGFPVPPSGEYINNFLVALVDSLGNTSVYNLTPGDFTAQSWNNFSILVNNTNFTAFPSIGAPADLTDITMIEFVAITGDGSGYGNYISIAIDNVEFSTPSTTTKTITKTQDNKFNRMLAELYTTRPPASLLGDYVYPFLGVSTIDVQPYIANLYTKIGADDATGDYSSDDANTEYMNGSMMGSLGSYIGSYIGWHHYFTIYENLADVTNITANIQGFSDDGGQPMYFYAWNDDTSSWEKEQSHSNTVENTLSIDITPPGDAISDYIDSNNMMHFAAIVDDPNYGSGYYEDYIELLMTFSQYTYSSNISATAAGGSTCIDAIPISPLNVTADAYPLADGTYVVRLTWDTFTGTYLYIHRDHLDASLNYIDSNLVQVNPLATLNYTDNQYIDSTGIYPGTTYTYNLRSANSCGQIDQPGREFQITVQEQEIGAPEIIIRMGVKISH